MENKKSFVECEQVLSVIEQYNAALTLLDGNRQIAGTLTI